MYCLIPRPPALALTGNGSAFPGEEPLPPAGPLVPSRPPHPSPQGPAERIDPNSSPSAPIYRHALTKDSAKATQHLEINEIKLCRVGGDADEAGSIHAPHPMRVEGNTSPTPHVNDHGNETRSRSILQRGLCYLSMLKRVSFSLFQSSVMGVRAGLILA